jgi:hypothetical protein
MKPEREQTRLPPWENQSKFIAVVNESKLKELFPSVSAGLRNYLDDTHSECSRVPCCLLSHLYNK